MHGSSRENHDRYFYLLCHRSSFSDFKYRETICRQYVLACYFSLLQYVGLEASSILAIGNGGAAVFGSCNDGNYGSELKLGSANFTSKWCKLACILARSYRYVTVVQTSSMEKLDMSHGSGGNGDLLASIVAGVYETAVAIENTMFRVCTLCLCVT